MELNLSKFGNVIATDEKSEQIYKEIKEALLFNAVINVNAKNMTISTKSARLIFGRLYKELMEKFRLKINIINASPLFMFSVNEGISLEMENN